MLLAELSLIRLSDSWLWSAFPFASSAINFYYLHKFLSFVSTCVSVSSTSLELCLIYLFILAARSQLQTITWFKLSYVMNT